MLDDRVRAVLSGQDTPLGRFLFALVTPQYECGVLEIGSRATIWLGAGVRRFGGSVVTVEPGGDVKGQVAEAGLEECVEVVESLDGIEDVFDVVVVAAEHDAGRLLPRIRELVEPGALIVSAAPLDDPRLLSVAVSVDLPMQLSVVLE
jgi:predicted O-methyltransferase YrrM